MSFLYLTPDLELLAPGKAVHCQILKQETVGLGLNHNFAAY